MIQRPQKERETGRNHFPDRKQIVLSVAGIIQCSESQPSFRTEEVVNLHSHHLKLQRMLFLPLHKLKISLLSSSPPGCSVQPVLYHGPGGLRPRVALHCRRRRYVHPGFCRLHWSAQRKHLPA